MPQDSRDITFDDAADLAAEPISDEAPAPAAADLPAQAERPADVPEKFWDAKAGALRTEALLKSYAELERKLGQAARAPAVDADGGEAAAAPVEAPPADVADGSERERLLALLGRPASPDEYRIEPPSALVEVDPALNARLHEAGFTQAQAQLVYELAAERLTPVIAEVAGELEARLEIERLQRHFGGAEAWRGVARQIRTWAEANLEPAVYATLAGSGDGVLALHQMMRAAEPTMLGGGGDGAAGEVGEDALGEMVRDPRYWRQRDPDFVAKVTAGFRKLYGS